ncbi:MAG TPA: glycosyltransferase [Verrucomicrobiae bacterium]|nr:glycosyltransferase [Verrucomicrobiae bacterium]
MPNEILYLCHSGIDYLQDGLYHGLVSLLGKGRVVDWPRQARFHERLDSLIPSVGFYSQSEPSRPQTAWGLRRQLRAGRFGLVAIAAGRKHAFRAWRDVMDACRQLPAVFVDGGDHAELAGQLAWERKTSLRRDVLNARPFDLIFKREHHGPDVNHPKILPIAFCLPENHYRPPSPPIKKTREVAFWGGASSASRAVAIEKLKNVRDFARNRSVEFRGEDFMCELAATKVCLSFWGAGDDTMRYWEIPCAGSLLMAQKPRSPIPDNFIDRREAVFVRDDLSDLIDLVNYYCDHDDEREEIARAGRKRFLKCHTTRARAKYFLDALHERNLYQAGTLEDSPADKADPAA